MCHADFGMFLFVPFGEMKMLALLLKLINRVPLKLKKGSVSHTGACFEIS